MGSSQSIDTTHVVLPSQVVPVGGGEVDKSDEALERIFRQIDIDGSGCIDERELKKAVARMYGRGLGGDIVQNMMKAGDVNADGLVDLNEFKAIMRAGPAQSARILTKVTLKGVEQQRRHEEALARARKLRIDKLDQIDEARQGNVDKPRNGMRNVRACSLKPPCCIARGVATTPWDAPTPWPRALLVIFSCLTHALTTPCLHFVYTYSLSSPRVAEHTHSVGGMDPAELRARSLAVPFPIVPGDIPSPLVSRYPPEDSRARGGQ